MVKNTNYLIIPIALCIIGATYWGYADSKGINSTYGILTLVLGVISVTFVIWNERKKAS